MTRATSGTVHVLGMTVVTEPAISTRIALELPLPFLARAAQAMLAGLGKRTDTLTPYLDVARYDGTRLMSTDRYKAAIVELPLKGERADDRHVLGEAVSIPRPALAHIAKLKLDAHQKRVRLATMVDAGVTVRIIADELGNLTVDIVDCHGLSLSSSAFAAAPAGNYPPVEKLLDRWQHGEGDEETFDGTILSPIVAYAASNPHGSTVLTIDFGKEKVHAWGRATPGATRITTADALFLINPLTPR